MSKRERDYSNLKETEKVYDAVERMTTEVKDYSMRYMVETVWRMNDYEIAKRLVRVCFDDIPWIGNVQDLLWAINGLVGDADEDGWLPRNTVDITGESGLLTISTEGVNKECLRDHVAFVTHSNKTAILDLEELLKATRYA